MSDEKGAAEKRVLAVPKFSSFTSSQPEKKGEPDRDHRSKDHGDRGVRESDRKRARDGEKDGNGRDRGRDRNRARDKDRDRDRDTSKDIAGRDKERDRRGTKDPAKQNHKKQDDRRDRDRGDHDEASRVRTQRKSKHHDERSNYDDRSKREEHRKDYDLDRRLSDRPKRNRSPSPVPLPRRDRDDEKRSGYRDHTRSHNAHRPPQRPAPLTRSHSPTPDDWYRINTRGDPQIPLYGPDTYRMPSFPRRPNEFVLGTENSFLVLHQEGNRKQTFSLRSGPRSHTAKFGDEQAKDLLRRRKLVFPTRLRCIFPAKTTKVSEENAKASENAAMKSLALRNGWLDMTKTEEVKDSGYIPLGPRQSEKKRRSRRDRPSITDSDGGDDSSGPDYRSLSGPAKAHEYSDSDVTFDDSDSDSTTLHEVSSKIDTPGVEVKATSVQLSRLVKDTPADIAAWLELVDLQDRLLLPSTRPPTPQERQSTADIKLTMLEKALGHATRFEDVERVQLAMMREGRFVWTAREQSRRWEAILRRPKADEQHLGKRDGGGRIVGLDLWLARLEAELTQDQDFSWDATLGLFKERIWTLRRTVMEVDIGSPGGGREDEFSPPPVQRTHGKSKVQETIEVARELVFIFLRMTRFLCDTGYPEMAVASWQAVLELNLARPPPSDSSPSGFLATLDRFEEFWDMEVPRIGDASPVSWARFLQDPSAVIQNIMSHKPENHADIEKDPLLSKSYRNARSAWAEGEMIGSAKNKLPKPFLHRNRNRADDGADRDDPFQIVTFDDIRSLVFQLPLSILDSVKCQFVDAFLLFCHLPPRFQADRWTHCALHDPFLQPCSTLSPYSRNSRSWEKRNSLAGTYGAEEMREDEHIFSFQRNPFPAGIVPRYVYELGERVPLLLEESPLDLPWAYRVLRALSHPYYQSNGSFSLAGPLADYEAILGWHLGLVNSGKRMFLSAETLAMLDLAGRPKTEIDTAPPSMPVSTGDPWLWKVSAWRYFARPESIRKNANLLTQSLHQLCHSITENKSVLQGTTTATLNGQPITAITSPSPTEILRCEQRLLSLAQSLRAQQAWDRASDTLQCLLLLYYLTPFAPTTSPEPTAYSQGNISKVVTAVETYSPSFFLPWSVDDTTTSASRQAHEQFLCTAVTLLYTHSQLGPFRRSYLHSHLETYLHHFPQNTFFLQVYEWNSSRMLLRRTSYKTFLQQLQRQPTLSNAASQTSRRSGSSDLLWRVQWLQYELRLGWSVSAATIDLAFRECLLTATGSHDRATCVALWKAYLRFAHHRLLSLLPTRSHAAVVVATPHDPEDANIPVWEPVLAANPHVVRALSIVHEALVHCPWSRDLLLLAIRDFGRFVPEPECDAWYAKLLRRGLRVHRDLHTSIHAEADD